MKGCTGLAFNANQGFNKPCPIRADCWRYTIHNRRSKPSGYTELSPGPYDFEDEECGMFEKS
jgi:hypothetical protein